MGIREYEYYHGAAILRALKAVKGRADVARLDSLGSGCYSVEDVGLFVKFARDRMSPWQFTFSSEQRLAVRQLEKKFMKVGILFVCNDDAIIVIDSIQLNGLLGKAPAFGSISVSRKPRAMASVSGSAGALQQKIRDSDFSRLF